MAVFQGIMKEMLEAEESGARHSARPRVHRRPHDGFEELAAHLGAVPWDEIVSGSGLSREQIREAAEIAMGARRPSSPAGPWASPSTGIRSRRSRRS
jgi:hypothetical protein